MTYDQFNYIKDNFGELRVEFTYLWKTFGLYEYDEEYSFNGFVSDLEKHINDYFDYDIILNLRFVVYDTYNKYYLNINEIDPDDCNMDNYKLIINFIDIYDELD